MKRYQSSEDQNTSHKNKYSCDIHVQHYINCKPYEYIWMSLRYWDLIVRPKFKFFRGKPSVNRPWQIWEKQLQRMRKDRLGLLWMDAAECINAYFTYCGLRWHRRPSRRKLLWIFFKTALDWLHFNPVTLSIAKRVIRKHENYRYRMSAVTLQTSSSDSWASLSFCCPVFFFYFLNYISFYHTSPPDHTACLYK